MRRFAAMLGWLILPLCALGGEPARVELPALTKALHGHLAKPDAEIDLGVTALLVSKEEFPQTDVAALSKQLDALAERFAAKLKLSGTASGKLDALRALLFEEEKFELPKRDDASAFLLSEVLRNKRGNCLGLSVLCLALAERTRLPLHGVPVPSRLSGPGHLLVRYDDGTTRLNFDPTERGAAHDDGHYKKLFKLRDEDVKGGYILGNATPRDVANLLLVNLGGARVEEGRAKEAVALLKKAVELKPNYAPAHNNLGAAWLALDDSLSAEAAFRQSSQLDAAFVAPRLGLSECALRRGEIAKAEEEIMTAEALEPDNLQARSLMANVHLARGEHRAAVTALKAVVEATPDDVRARCNLGTACRLGGDFPAAEQQYRAALGLRPEHSDAYYGLGETLRAVAKLDEAHQAFADALKFDPAHAPTRLALAQIARQGKDLRSATAQYEKILNAQPAHLEALEGLLEVLLLQKNVKEAERRLGDATLAHPDSVAVKMILGDALLKTGNAQAAQAHFQAILPKIAEDKRAPVLQRLAVCKGKLGDHRGALETAQLVLKNNAKDVPALRVAAAACEGLRNAPQASAYYKKVLELLPEDPQALQALKRLAAR